MAFLSVCHYKDITFISFWIIIIIISYFMSLLIEIKVEKVLKKYYQVLTKSIAFQPIKKWIIINLRFHQLSEEERPLLGTCLFLLPVECCLLFLAQFAVWISKIIDAFMIFNSFHPCFVSCICYKSVSLSIV